MKKLICILLALMLGAMLFAACGVSTGSSSAAAPASEAAPASAAASEAAPAESTGGTAPAGDWNWKVGFINLADSDENCFLATTVFKDTVSGSDFATKVGAPQDIEVIALDSQLDIQKQQDHIENLITQEVDMIFLIGADTEGNTASVKAANDAGIPIFMVATTASGGDYTFVGWDEYQYGVYQGEWAAENFPEGAKYCYMDGTSGREAFQKREAGFMDIIEEKRPDCEMLSVQASENTTAEEAMQITEDWITQYGDEIDAVVTQSNNTVVGAIEALKAAGMIDDVIVIGGIHTGTWDVDMLRSGEQNYAVYVGFSVLGETCVDICEGVYGGESYGDEVMMEIYHVDQDNIDEYFG